MHAVLASCGQKHSCLGYNWWQRESEHYRQFTFIGLPTQDCTTVYCSRECCFDTIFITKVIQLLHNSPLDTSCFATGICFGSLSITTLTSLSSHTAVHWTVFVSVQVVIHNYFKIIQLLYSSPLHNSCFVIGSCFGSLSITSLESLSSHTAVHWTLFVSVQVVIYNYFKIIQLLYSSPLHNSCFVIGSCFGSLSITTPIQQQIALPSFKYRWLLLHLIYNCFIVTQLQWSCPSWHSAM